MVRGPSPGCPATTRLRRKPTFPAELTTLGSIWELAETAVKPYPVCHFIHGCADAAIELHQRIDCADIVRAEALLPRDTMPIVAEPHDAKIRPTNEYEAKFSARRGRPGRLRQAPGLVRPRCGRAIPRCHAR